MASFLQDFLAAGQNGLQLIATAVLPVLFPFFVLTTMILNLTTVSRPWLVAALAYCSGYPNGARLTQNLYHQQRINLTQAQQLSIITSTPSPIFVVATAGTVFLQDTKLGCVIFLCAIVAAVLNEQLWRLYRCDHSQPTAPNNFIAPTVQRPPHFFSALGDALASSTTAIVNVCGVVLFFYIAAALLHLPPLLAGLLEMTTGVAATTNPLLIQFFVTFGGLSVAMQQQIFMQNFHIKLRTYFAYKITHAIFACALLSLYLLFLD